LVVIWKKNNNKTARAQGTISFHFFFGAEKNKKRFYYAKKPAPVNINTISNKKGCVTLSSMIQYREQ
jgi:hypothetical protein